MDRDTGRSATADDIIEQADIVDIVGEHVQLKKSGKDYRGPCPFHTETSPSFYVMPIKRMFYCFGCKAAGNAIQFVQRVYGLSFHEAAARVGTRYGLLYQGGRQRPEEISQREKIVRLNGLAARFYGTVLASDEGLPGRKYLGKRGIGEGAAERFHLGYSVDEWDRLSKQAGRKFKPNDLVEAGLCAAGQGGRTYDRFRGRLMFPITTLQGEVVGFGARALGDEEPKYLNTAETAVFSKGKLLYGLEQARDAIRKNGTAVIVEGYTDVIACHQAGRTDVLATLGTALTEDHVRLLSRLAERIIVAFDADSAGQGAVVRSAETLENARVPVFVAVLPQGEDPDSLVRRNGVEALEAVLSSAVPLMHFTIDRLVSEHTDERGLQTEQAATAVSDLLASIHNPTTREALLDHGAKRLALGDEARVPRLLGALRAQAMQAVKRRVSRDRGRRQPGRGNDKEFDTGSATAHAKTALLPGGVLRAEMAVLRAALCDAAAARDVLTQVDSSAFLRSETREIASAIARTLEDGRQLNEGALLAEVSQAAQELLGLLAAPSIDDAGDEASVKQSIDTVRDYREEQRYLELKDRVARIPAAEQRSNPEMAEFMELARRRHANGTDRFSPGTGI